MQLTSLLRSAAIMAVLSVLSLLLFQTAHAETETDLYNFCSAGGASCLDGEDPVGPLAAGTNGTFYAASGSGGSSGSGTVFGLEPEPAGGCEGINQGNGWCEFVLYNFCSVANCARRKRAFGQSVLPQHALPHTETFTARPTRAGATMPASSSKSVPNHPCPIARRAATRAAAGARRCSITSAPFHLEATARMVIIRSGISSRTRPVIFTARLRMACFSCLTINKADGIAS